MRQIYRIKFIILALTAFILTACSNDDGPKSPVVEPDSVTRAILVYAVNNSNLAGDFDDDVEEMIKGISTVNDSHCQLLVYNTDIENNNGVLSIVQPDASGEYNLKSIRTFGDQTLATDTQRLSEVIDFVLTMYPNATYDLILWGHGSAWQYSANTTPNKVIHKSFGGGYDGSGSKTQYWTNIDGLADAIPDGRFSVIWFDSCLMSNIEVVYQLRNKCDTFVGYASEVYGGGMDYSRVLPLLFAQNRDIVTAAKSFFNSYNDYGLAVTVAVMKMAEIEELAQVSSKILKNSSQLPRKNELTNYSRAALRLDVDFYDLRQYLTKIALLNHADEATMQTDENDEAAMQTDEKDEAAILINELDEALGKFVLYHAASSKNFSGFTWDVSTLSCISTHYYTNTSSAQDTYYRTLDWFTRVYE